MISFFETREFGITINEVFRGLLMGGALGTYVTGGYLDEQERAIAGVGALAYNATGQIEPALLAMVLHAQLGSKKAEVFKKLEELGVAAKNIKGVFPKAEDAFNYRILWDQTVKKNLIDNFPEIPAVSQTAILAHTIAVIDRLNGPHPAPKEIQKTVMTVAQTLYSLAADCGIPLADELRKKLLFTIPPKPKGPTYTP